MITYSKSIYILSRIYFLLVLVLVLVEDAPHVDKGVCVPKLGTLVPSEVECVPGVGYLVPEEEESALGVGHPAS